jgi:hypothetical protein
MQVGIVASGSCAGNQRVFFLLGQFLKRLIYLLGDQETLLDPSLDTARGPNSHKTPLAVKDLHPVAVLGRTNLVVNLDQLVAKYDLRSGDVINLEDTPVVAPTRENYSHTDQACE